MGKSNHGSPIKIIFSLMCTRVSNSFNVTLIMLISSGVSKIKKRESGQIIKRQKRK